MNITAGESKSYETREMGQGTAPCPGRLDLRPDQIEKHPPRTEGASCIPSDWGVCLRCIDTQFCSSSFPCHIQDLPRYVISMVKLPAIMMKRMRITRDCFLKKSIIIIHMRLQHRQKQWNSQIKNWRLCLQRN